MNLTEYIGLIAGFLITFSLVPQIIRVVRLKSAIEISLVFTAAQLMGVLLWLTYGIRLNLIPIIFWNIIGTLLAMTLLGAKLKYGRHGLK